MATEQEIKTCCKAMHDAIKKVSIYDDMELRGSRVELQLISGVLYLLESFLLDVKRIADAITDDEEDGMANK